MPKPDWDRPPPVLAGFDTLALRTAVDRINRSFAMMTVAMAGAAIVVGDRLRMMNDPNRLRRIVDEVYDRHHYGIVTYTRPSRGWRRHVRRVKATERRNR